MTNEATRICMEKTCRWQHLSIYHCAQATVRTETRLTLPSRTIFASLF